MFTKATRTGSINTRWSGRPEKKVGHQPGCGSTPWLEINHSVVDFQPPRQTGKSTLAQALAGSDHPADYLSLDNAAVLAAASADPEGFIHGLNGPVILDEVQRAPGLALAIKATVDADRRPGRFLLTGSANMMVLPRISESLTGRIEIHTLWPLSLGEISGSGGTTFVDRLFAAKFTANTKRRPLAFSDLAERVVGGGYPEVLARTRPARRAAWFDAYINAILQRDVREISNIEHLADMPRLLSLLSARTSSLLNYANLARDMALPQSTVKRYLTLLEATFMVRRLPAWSANVGKRLTKSPKVQFVDTGVAAHLLDVDAARFEAERNLAGPVLENFVAMEIVKQLSWSQSRCGLFHFRTETGQEVDLVLEDRRGQLTAIEVKAARSIQEKDFRGLRALEELAGDRLIRGVLLYTGDVAVPFGKNLHALPINALWENV